ncbi:MAG: alpha-N-arabinofuranosidase [Actinomycetota bacterium]|nr:alpha-N-arabinofuranosidase [Actinomycetota bacterium]
MDLTTQERAPLRAVVTVRADAASQVDPMIYGHFLESNFYGNIEGGVIDAAGPEGLGELRNSHLLRSDVIACCRELKVPIVRWPGGNFTSAYHFQDGIGPPRERPRRLELAWGGEEANRFGTEEFLDWCEAVGTEPFLVNSARNLEEALAWLEYTNYRGDTSWTRRRAQNGRSEARPVTYWGVGNEVYGDWQMGHRSAEAYAADAREHADFMRRIDPSLRLVGVGFPSKEWMAPFLRAAGDRFDYVSLHLYAASAHRYGAAGEDDYEQVVAQPLYFEREIGAFSELVCEEMAASTIERPIAIALDEWNIRHLEPSAWPEQAPHPDGGAKGFADAPGERWPLRVNRWSSRTLADALFYAGVFHVLHRAARRPVPVGMANTVNLINANGLIEVRGEQVIRSASYYVWKLYQHHLGDEVLDVDVEGPGMLMRVREGAAELEQNQAGRAPAQFVPYLDVVATRRRGRDGFQVAVINRHRDREIELSLRGEGIGADGEVRAHLHRIGGDVDDVLAVNTASRPDAVTIVEVGHVVAPGGNFRFPPHSISVLEVA